MRSVQAEFASLRQREKALPYTLGLMAFFAILWLVASLYSQIFPFAGMYWFMLQFLVFLITPPLWLTFAFSLSRYHYFSKWEGAALIVPLLTLSFALMPATQPLLWSMLSLDSGRIIFNHGPWMRIHLLGSHLTLLAAGLVIARQSLYWFSGTDRTRHLILILAVAPLFTSIGYMALAISPYTLLEPLPLITLGCALLLMRITRRRFAELRAARSIQPNLLAVMSHEARTLASGIVGVSDILERTHLSSEQQALLGMMRTSGSTLLHVVNGTLDLERIEAGQLALQKAPLRIRGCIEHTFENVAVQALNRRLHLGYIIDSDVPEWIVGDERRIEQILLNLVYNGLKFTEQGGVLVHVGMHPGSGEPKPTNLCFAVHDTGIGIPLEVQERLFIPFSQVATEGRFQRGGSGLGLTISRRLAQLMGGSLTLAASNPQGSTFHFHLPAIAVPVEASPTESIRHGQRILLCAEASPAQAMLTAIAEHAGVSLVHCATPSAAAQALAADGLFSMIWVIESSDPGQYDDLLSLLNPAHIPPVTLITWPQCDHVDLQLQALNPTILYQPLTHSAVMSALHGPYAVPQPEPIPQIEVVSPDTAPLTVLVVDDSPLNRDVAQMMLQSLGHAVEVVATAEAALRTLGRASYDIALLDIHIGDADGRDLTRTIRRQIPPDRQPYLVALSGLSIDEHGASYQEAGFNAWFEKPLTLAKLRQMLADYHSNRAVVEPAAGYDPFTEQAAIDERTWREFTTMTGMSEPIIRSFVDDYITDTDQLVRDMRRSLHKGDMDRIAHAAHKLKSSSALFSANRLADLCHAIDNNRHNPIGYADAVSMIESEYRRVRDALARRNPI